MHVWFPCFVHFCANSVIKVHVFHLVLRDEGVVSTAEEAECYHAKGPDIHLAIMLLVRDDLWSLEQRRAHITLQTVEALRCEAEVRQLDVHFLLLVVELGNEQIFELQVAMYDVFRMVEVVKRVKQLPEHVYTFNICETLLLNDEFL